jgi:hypothetical protein
MKATVKHKRVGGNGLWWTLCNVFGTNSTWVNTWKAVTCKRCLKLKGSTNDWLKG